MSESGERIQFGSNVNIIFECEDLRFASPATVSRTSMIIFCSDLITSSVLAAKWLSSLVSNLTSHFVVRCMWSETNFKTEKEFTLS